MVDKIVLGVESTAHTFGVSIIKGFSVLSNSRRLFTTNKGGMIPVKVAEHHIDVCDDVLKESLDVAGVKLKDIDLIAFSSSPGIGHTLRIGAVFARILASKLDKPLVGVNHCIAHLEIGRILSGLQDPILLYASGANTQIIAYEAGKYRVFGETLDIGIGNFIDSFARELGLGFPGGPKVEELAKKGKKLVDLPYSVKGMDVSLGGILTNLKKKIDSKLFSKEDLCYSVQEIVFAMLVEVTERAVAHTGKTSVVLGGGVACNSRLQEMTRLMCEERNIKFFCPEKQFLVDNAAMIAITGLLIFESDGCISIDASFIDPYKRTDEIIINYR
ncbi:N(6)-L-threonylcarbamoyladenine synthase Kae1 [Candidatus Woesearchaeota archaeon]|nr:N(6)-L-threonylcarbamoyladenine synthase Kae1 [Candidatus Woesearchaeota archaeon]MCF7901233.1 N(6)-L-threonylcarbamoyladenine synthase Kae1 [Candidatus Woesearchaeota archaeon]MCF8013762.1 N(6)-L-threonylcarbamoyladenine synthase Kae1 [Candidatus Woesearchaeota archaeon]